MQDPEVLARAIPGCEGLEKTGPDEYRMKMKMALASLSGAFEGKVKITDQTPPLSFRLLVEGTGKIGSVDPLSIIHDSNEGQSTIFHIDCDMQAPCIETIFQ